MRYSSLITIALLAAGTTTVLAQGWQSQTIQPGAPKPRAAAPAPAQSAPPAQRIAAKPAQPAPIAHPVAAQIQFLVRTSLLTLNDANRSGNYTVLRDVAAPSFRDRNSPADLSQIFAEMRRAKLDLSMAAFMAAELDDQPSIDGERRLHLKGHLPTEPNRIVFDLVFEAVSGHWLINSISIATRPSRTAAGGPTPLAR